MTRPLAAATLLAAVLAPAAAAPAATKTVDYGLKNPPSGLPETASLYDFFPRTVKVRAGDSIKYRVFGFAIPYSGPKSEIPALVQVSDDKVTGSEDAAGNPLWFEGQLGAPGLNPAVMENQGDGVVKPGQEDVDHGTLGFGPSEPLELTFPKPGKYKVRDALHPDIVNTVKVVGKGKRVPGKAADDARAAKQAAKLVKEAQRLDDVTAPGNTILIGNDSKRVGFFQYFPPAATVKAGQPLTISVGRRVNDVHNIAVGPKDFMRNLTKNLFMPGPGGVGINPVGVYPSQPPSDGGMTFSGTEQGGFLNTGFMDSDAKSPLPAEATVTFTAPGTYKYVCSIHSNGVQGMSGTITVE